MGKVLEELDGSDFNVRFVGGLAYYLHSETGMEPMKAHCRTADAFIQIASRQGKAQRRCSLLSLTGTSSTFTGSTV